MTCAAARHEDARNKAEIVEKNWGNGETDIWEDTMWLEELTRNEKS